MYQKPIMITVLGTVCLLVGAIQRHLWADDCPNVEVWLLSPR